MKGKTSLALLLALTAFSTSAFASTEQPSTTPNQHQQQQEEAKPLKQTETLKINNLQFGSESKLNDTQLVIDITSKKTVFTNTVDLELSERGIILHTKDPKQEYILSNNPIYIPYDTVVFRTTLDGYKYVPHTYSYIDKSVTIHTKDLNDLVILERSSELDETIYTVDSDKALRLSQLGILDPSKKPTDEVTREDFANTVSLIHGFESKIGGINTLFERGILKEYRNTESITNQQASLVMYRTLLNTNNYKPVNKNVPFLHNPVKFDDAKDISKEALVPVTYLSAARVYEGIPTFNPNKPLTYQTLVKILIPYMKLVDTY